MAWIVRLRSGLLCPSSFFFGPCHLSIDTPIQLLEHSCEIQQLAGTDILSFHLFSKDLACLVSLYGPHCHHSMQILSLPASQSSLLRLKDSYRCHNILGLWARPTLSVWRVVWFPPRLAPDHMLGFGIGRNIWFLVRKEINRIRIMIW